MLPPRRKPLVLGGLCLLLVWLLAGGAYVVVRHARVTAEKVRTYLRAVDLGTLSGTDRAKALARLAGMLNSLPYTERREARLAREWQRWFDQMTEAEKTDFLDATAPTGFKQMLSAFEELPADRRKRVIDDALKHLKESRAQLAEDGGEGAREADTNSVPVLSEELRQKVTTIGLKSYYSETSAQTKAELAPVLEELQQAMQNGAFWRDRPRFNE